MDRQRSTGSRCGWTWSAFRKLHLRRRILIGHPRDARTTFATPSDWRDACCRRVDPELRAGREHGCGDSDPRKYQLVRDRVRCRTDGTMLEEARLSYQRDQRSAGVSGRRILTALAKGHRSVDCGVRRRPIACSQQECRCAPGSPSHPLGSVATVLDRLELLDKQIRSWMTVAGALKGIRSVIRVARCPDWSGFAQQIIAEVGVDAQTFPSAGHSVLGRYCPIPAEREQNQARGLPKDRLYGES